MNHINGSSSSKSDLTVSYTLFPHIWPKTAKRILELSWTEFVQRLKNLKEYPSKHDCPLISMCDYGETLSLKGYLRHRANVLTCWGCELDYDGEKMTLEAAHTYLKRAGVICVLYTSPSHRQYKPRWRALFPFRDACLPEDRARMLGRVNALLSGVASHESFTLSQSFFFGRVKGSEWEVRSVDSGKCIDELNEIEPLLPNGKGLKGYDRDPTTDEELRDAFRLGVGRYEAMRKLAARWAARGFSHGDIVSNLTELLGESESTLNEDGIDLSTRIEPLATSAVERFGDSRKLDRYDEQIILKEVTIRKKASNDREIQLPDLPEGIVRDVYEWSRKRAMNINPKLDLAVAFTAVALSTVNRYVVEEFNTPLQPYFMSLAPTGGGKSEAQKSLFHFARRISRGGLNFLDFLFAGFQSYHALFDKLAEEPHVVCWTWDEAARVIKTAGRNPSGPDFQVLSSVLDAFGRSNDILGQRHGRHQSIPTIEHPFLLVLAMAQPDELVRAVTQTDFDTGFLARMILLDAGESIPPRNDQRSDLFPTRIIRHCSRFREGAENGFQKIKFDTGIRARWLEYDDYRRKRQEDSPQSKNLWSRSMQQALMIAGLLAVSRSVERPLITTDLFEYATALASHSSVSWIRRMGSEAAGVSPYDKLRLRVEDLIQNPTKSVARSGSMKHKEWAKKGFVPRTNLMRSIRSQRRRDAEEVIEMLLESRVVERKVIDTTTCYRWLGE